MFRARENEIKKVVKPNKVINLTSKTNTSIDSKQSKILKMKIVNKKI